jgi:hypothetical protein
MTNLITLNAEALASTVAVRMTVTLDVKGKNKRIPEVRREDVTVKQGKERLKVIDWAAAREDRSGLNLFFLLDDASDTSLGTQLADLRSFIETQETSTFVGVGYMSNAGVRIAQDFTFDHVAAAKALRLPIGTEGAFGAPYLSAVSLMKRWPDNKNRRVVVMVSDGKDRPRRGLHFGGVGSVSPDVDTASSVAQRTGTIIHTIYSPGVTYGRGHYWERINGQNGMAKLSYETGGESFFLGLRPAVSFTPYLNRIREMLDNQYLLTFAARPGKKAGLQRMKLSTEVAGVEFISADSVWVPAAT